MQCGDEAIDFIKGVVGGKRDAGERREAEMFEGRLRAKVAGTDGDVVAIEESADVKGMHTLDGEAEDGAFVGRSADDFQARDGGEFFSGVGQELLIIEGDVRTAD